MSSMRQPQMNLDSRLAWQRRSMRGAIGAHLGLGSRRHLRVVLLGAALLLGMCPPPGNAAPPESPIALGDGYVHPGTRGLVGWPVKGAPNREAALDLRASNLASSVSGLLGYNPFTVGTHSGSRSVSRGIDADLAAELGACAPETQHVCTVMLSLPAQPALEQHLTAQGCEVIRPVSVNSYAVRADAATLQTLAQDSYVYWVGQVPTELKVSPLLARNLGLVGFSHATADPADSIDASRAVVSLYDGADAAHIQREIAAAGGRVLRTRPGGEAIVVEGLGARGTAAVAALPEVCYIDGYATMRTHLESSNAVMGGQDVIGRDPWNRWGSGIELGMIDSGFRRNHDMFQTYDTLGAVQSFGLNMTTQVVNWYEDNPTGHGTHVAGIILGRWIPKNLLGAAPWNAISPALPFSIRRCGENPPADPNLVVNADLAMSSLFNAPLVLAINNSWGSPETAPTSSDAVWADALVWQMRQAWVFSAGNEGNAAGTIGTPALAKNVIAVGSVDNTSAHPLSNFSSEGPTTDGRQKPDIYAPGGVVVSADATDPKASIAFSGTSMAAPHVTGFLATLMDHIPAVKRRPQLAKAMMMAAASPAADLQPHTGLLNAEATHFTTNFSGLFYGTVPGDLLPSSAGTSWEINGLPGGLKGLYCVLTWVEPPATAGAAHALINDIDLLIDYGKEGFIDYSSTRTFDNVETVYIPDPPAGSYRFIADAVTTSTTYNPALAVFAFTDNSGLPRGGVLPDALLNHAALKWSQPPPPSARGAQPMNLVWTLENAQGVITQHQAHFGKTTIESSVNAPVPAINTYTLATTAPNVGGFDSPAMYQYVLRALDDATEVLSPVARMQVVTGPIPPTVQWVVPPPASINSGQNFLVQWRLTNFQNPATSNAVGWGVTSLLGQTANQPGSNATYTETITAPVVAQPTGLLYVAFATNGVEFAFSSLTPVTINP